VGFLKGANSLACPIEGLKRFGLAVDLLVQVGFGKAFNKALFREAFGREALERPGDAFRSRFFSSRRRLAVDCTTITATVPPTAAALRVLFSFC